MAGFLKKNPPLIFFGLFIQNKWNEINLKQIIQAYIIDNVALNYDRCPEIQNQKEIKTEYYVWNNPPL